MYDKKTHTHIMDMFRKIYIVPLNVYRATFDTEIMYIVTKLCKKANKSVSEDEKIYA